jgi:hypothetical protein
MVDPPLDPKRGDEILGRLLRTPPQPKRKPKEESKPPGERKG